jgi:type VI secretion system protein ImpA
MAVSSEIFDLHALVAPLAGENPAGQDVQYSAYDLIKEFRRSDPDPKIKRSEWSTIIATANEVLSTQSKDLRVAVWLTEALIREHGFPALSYGLRLLTELQTRFWENLYPQISAGDLDYRLAPIQWLTSNLPIWIGSIPLTDCEGENFNSLQRQSYIDGKGNATAAQFDQAVKATPRSFYEAAQEELQQAREELARFKEFVDGKFGKGAPSFTKIEEAIEDCQNVIANLLRSKPQPDKPQPAKPSILSTLFKKFTGKEAADGSPGRGANGQGSAGSQTETEPMPEVALKKDYAAPGKPSGNLTEEPESREDAFRRLEVIAKYLKRVEPHSPVSYLIERAVRWGRMPLESWLNEVIQNDDLLKRLRDTLGIKEGPAN